jgi:hypothetical protein
MTDRAVEFVSKAVRMPSSPGKTDWQRMLDFADRTQMTLLLRYAPGLPDWVSREIAVRTEKNAERLRRLRAAYQEVSAALLTAGVDFILLKGFSHAAFGINPLDRVQYDIDLLCEPHMMAAAAAALERIGYAPHSEESLSDQHLPPYVKPTEWRWTGDYFDPGMPIAIELHTTVWEPETDRIRLVGPDLFWNRRHREVPWFCLADRAAYAALHALRHVIRNDARPAHVFELACFLDVHARDSRFWEQWTALHDVRLRRLQAIVFRFAVEWFGCSVPDAVANEIASLSPRIHAWFDDFAWSPVLNIVQPNKDVIWLHVALVGSSRDRLVVLRRRLLPLHRPKAPGSVAARRLRHHAFAIAPVLASGFRWWRRCAAS